MLTSAVFRILFICFAAACTPCHPLGNQSTLKGIQVDFGMQLIGADTLIMEMQNSYTIFYYDSLEFFKYRYEFDSSYDDVRNITQREAYLLFQKGSTEGHRFEKKQGRFTHEVVPVKFYLENIRVKFDLDKYVNLHPDTSDFDQKSGILKETYLYPALRAGDRSQTVYLYYSEQYKDRRESFSKELDSAKGKKVFRYEIVSHQYYNTEKKMMVPELNSLYEMKAPSAASIREADTVLKEFLRITAKE